jgi:hypothetical protein
MSGQSTDETEYGEGVCVGCGERKPVHVCHGDLWRCSCCCNDEDAGTGRCERSTVVGSEQCSTVTEHGGGA